MRAALLGALALLLAVACGDDDDGAVSEDIDAAALVAAAAERMEQVESFRFDLTQERATIEIVRGIEMTTASGEIAGPDRLRVEVEGEVGPLNFEIGIVILPDESWIQNPLTGRWEREDISIEELFDPQSGIVALMRAVEAPELLGRDSIDGVDTYRIGTDVDSGDLSIFPSAEPGRTVPATAWIGVDEPYVYRLEVRGALGDGDEDRAVRRLDLRDFDTDIEIAPPR